MDSHPRRVAILDVPRHFPLDVALPRYVLGSHPGYRVVVCGDSLAGAETADIVLVPGYHDPQTPPPGPYLTAIRAAHDRGARIVAVCTGAFALAAAGILHGRRATTHWQFADLFRRTHPDVDMRGDSLLVEDGRIVTSAGAAAEIDACLHLIRADFGADAADEVARAVQPTPSAGDGLHAVREWVTGDLAAPITVQRMADHSLLSRRTFIRRFTRETGQSPMRWVTAQRLLGARRLLETSDWPIERIAAATGLGTAANLRTLFRRELGTTPSAYRRSRLP